MNNRFYILMFLMLLNSFIMAQSAVDKNLSLRKCKQLAIENNLKIKQANSKLKMAEYHRKSAFTSFFPDIDFSGQYLLTNKKWYLLEENQFFPVVPFWAIDQQSMELVPEVEQTPLAYGTMIDPETGEVMTDDEGNPVFLQYGYIPRDEMTFGNTHSFLLNGGITQPIFLGGKILRYYKMSEIIEDIQKDRKKISEDEVLYEVEKVYWKLVSLKQKKKLADSYKTMLDTLVKELNNIYEEGIIIRNDLLKAQKKQNEIAYQQFKAENGIRLANMALNQLIGLPMDSTPQISGNLDEVRVFTDKNGMISKALKSRPEIGVLNKSVQLADQSVKLAWSRFLPNIVGTANYTYVNPNPYNGFKNEFGGDYSFGITCRIPITSWGDRLFSLKSSKEARELAKIKKEEAEQQISLQVNQSWNQYLEAFKKVEFKKKSLEQAKENLRVMENKFDEGMITPSDLLESQAMWQDAYSELIEAQTNLRIKEIEIKKISGQL